MEVKKNKEKLDEDTFSKTKQKNDYKNGICGTIYNRITSNGNFKIINPIK